MSPRPKKSLGQVFIKDKNIIDKIIQTAGIGPDDHVVEIGCGEGWLSRRLAEEAKSLTIIEIDPGYAEEARERLSDFDNVTFLIGDVLKLGFENVQAPTVKLVANIPYYISAKIVQLLVRDIHRLSDALIMVQKEFASKLIAPSGTKAYSSLAVYTQAHFDVSVPFHISKQSFRPVPKVDSSMLFLKPNIKLPDDVDRDLFFSMVQSAFWGRRKTLLSCLKNSPHLSLNGAADGLAFFADQSAIRGEMLTLDDFVSLYQELKSQNLV